MEIASVASTNIRAYAYGLYILGIYIYMAIMRFNVNVKKGSLSVFNAAVAKAKIKIIFLNKTRTIYSVVPLTVCIRQFIAERVFI